MNAQLQSTIDALSGGITNLDADTALSTIGSWLDTLDGVPGTEAVVGGLTDLQTALTNGDLEGAAALLPSLGNATAAAASAVPQEDVDGINQLAGLLQG